MAFAHSKASRVLLNATHQSGQISGYSVAGARAYGECTTLLDEGGKYVPGLRSGSLSVQGRFNSDAGALDEVFQAVIGTDNGALWTVCPAGYALGSPCFIVASDPSGYAVDASVSDVVGLTIEATPDDGVDRGVVLHALGAETADGDGTSVDGAASSASGGVASLHVTAFTGLTSAVIKIQDSSDDSTFADLITFTSVTGTTFERSTVAGTVDRYLRVSVDVTGTGSLTFLAAFARR